MRGEAKVERRGTTEREEEGRVIEGGEGTGKERK